ncbi:MAG: short-chain dehydrogenase [Clostridia bacterium BRH_c25]|nr:MAG: short-chain dehydrogenase [Clostridia bacterium BRH_c25]
MSTKGKTALVTGASSGIGFELSRILAKNGYDLILVSQNEENLNEAVSRLHEQNRNVQITPLPKDLSQPSSPQEIYGFVKEKSIRVDILANCAGIQVYGNFHETNPEDNIRLMSVNMLALTKLTRLFLDDMVKRSSGKILNVASTGAFQPCPLNAVYCASKAYVLHFSEGIAEELRGSGVTVTALCPGATKTNFAKRAKIEDTRMFSSNLMEAGKVAEIGYSALMKGKTVVVPGISNKLMVESIRFSPRSMVTRIGKNLMSRK